MHNAGLYIGAGRLKGKEGIPSLFAVNTLAPYVLTCLIKPTPKRLVYVSSGLHSGGDARLNDVRRASYGDSKLHNIMLAFAFARKWPDVYSNAVDPGWVATKMGGASAPGDLNEAIDTFAMLAAGGDAAMDQTSKYWYLRKTRSCKPEAKDQGLQDGLLKKLEEISGVELPP